jgi:tripartite-type tricarboxylate transporter receptor subunit TctC
LNRPFLRRLRSALVLLLLAPPGVAFGQAYPTRPIKLVVGTNPGGGIDIVGRMLAGELEEQLHGTVIVENRPGASGAIAAELVKNAAPDGYTLLCAFTGQMVTNPVVHDVPFDPERDFAPVAMLGRFPLVLVVSPKLPATSVAELIEYARSRPGKLNYASGSAAFQFLTEIFKQKTGTDIRYIPYTGTAKSVLAVVTGTVDMTFADLPPALPQIQSRGVRALAVTTAQRTDLLPGVPALAETLPGFEYVLWTAVFAPAGTPARIVDRLQRDIARAVQAPEVREKMLSVGVVPSTGTPQELAATLRRDLALIRERAPSVLQATGASK